MPSVAHGPKKSGPSILNRSESLRSEVSDASVNKKVSFNKDVRIRRIPQSAGNIHGQVVAVLEPRTGLLPGNSTSGCLWINSKLQKSESVEQGLLAEAERILNNVDKIQCSTSSAASDASKNKRFLERSKSELVPNGFRRSKSEPPVSAGVSDLDFLANRLDSYTKPVRIKKPRRRVGLDGIAVDSPSSSGSEARHSDVNKNVSSDSPLSSISGDGHNMATTSQRYGSSPRVSSMVTKLGTNRREQAGPPLRSSFLEAGSGNTHNNNQPFSYTGNPRSELRTNGHQSRTNGPGTLESRTNGHGARTPREIIYAQVVSREKKDGTPEKRTIHKKYSDLTTSTTASDSPADFQKHIRHFVYDKENWKNLNESHNNSSDSSHLLSTYRGRSGGSQYGSKNNVTTVLLNSNDEEDSLRSTTITNNDLFKNSHRSSSSPPRLTDRPFFYGDTRLNRVKAFDHSSSSSPQFQYSSSSREQSPAGVTTSKVLKNSDPRKTAAVIPETNPKLRPSAYSTVNSRNHTDYQYMTSKLGYLTPSEYSVEVSRLPPRPRPASMDRVAPQYTNQEVKVNGWSKSAASNRAASADYKRNQNSYNYPTYSTAENNRKNREGSETHSKRSETLKNAGGYESVQTLKPSKPLTSGSHNGSTGGGGLISSLMRRSKDKKVIRDKTSTATVPPPTVGKVKPKNKFLSLFFDSSKNGTSKKSEKLKAANGRGSNQTKMKHIVTDSEIDDAERKRDGEYHSWSSVDGSYRLDPRKGDPRQKEKLSRGKSYNFGDYEQIRHGSWQKEDRDNDSEDYRRDLARTNYKSATLGRPVARSATERVHDDSMTSRTKSLDRRNFRPNRYDQSPPKLIVTPSSPPVNESEYRWDSPKAKLGQKLSKSSVELDNYGRHFEESVTNGRRSPSKLRYFGDTDVEQSSGRHSRVDSPPPSFRHGKMDQGYHGHHYGQNGNDQHLSRRETLLGGKGRNDGLHSSEESESRFSKSSSRSVFLHAPTVAEIPPPGGLQRRTLSKDEISNYSGSQKQTRHLARSMSVLAPWRPRPTKEKYEVRYDNEGYLDTKLRRPPKPPRSPNQKSISPVPPMKHHRSESSENLLESSAGKSREVNKASTLGRLGGTLKRSKSSANDSSGSWLPLRRDKPKKLSPI